LSLTSARVMEKDAYLGNVPPSSAVRIKLWIATCSLSNAFSRTSSGNLVPSVRAFTLRLKFSLMLR
uniref:Uncharacterized protein n=1 Tax=Laticauda laticaudata TaxID=8630 RepID=A0A8C5WY80_LATLA